MTPKLSPKLLTTPKKLAILEIVNSLGSPPQAGFFIMDNYARLLYEIFGDSLWHPIPKSQKDINNPLLGERIKKLLMCGFTLNEIREGWGIEPVFGQGYSRARVATNTTEANAIFEYIKSAYNNRCAYCNKKTTHLTKDHVVPVSQGGEDDMENIVPSCRRCNSSKNSKNLLDWDCFYKLQVHFLDV